MQIGASCAIELRDNVHGGGSPAGCQPELQIADLVTRVDNRPVGSCVHRERRAYAGTCSYVNSGAPARFEACSIVIAQIFPWPSRSRTVFSSRSRVSRDRRVAELHQQRIGIGEVSDLHGANRLSKNAL